MRIKWRCPLVIILKYLLERLLLLDWYTCGGDKVFGEKFCDFWGKEFWRLQLLLKLIGFGTLRWWECELPLFSVIHSPILTNTTACRPCKFIPAWITRAWYCVYCLYSKRFYLKDFYFLPFGYFSPVLVFWAVGHDKN